MSDVEDDESAASRQLRLVHGLRVSRPPPKIAAPERKVVPARSQSDAFYDGLMRQFTTIHDRIASQTVDTAQRKAMLASLASLSAGVRGLTLPPSRRLCSLPLPLQTLIVRYLPMGEHFVLRFVCTSLRAAATAKSAWPERLLLDGPPRTREALEGSSSSTAREPRSYQEHFFVELEGRVTDLDVTFPGWDHLTALLAPSLTALRAPWLGDADYGALGVVCPSLTSLCLTDENPDEHHLLDVACVPALRRLRVHLPPHAVATLSQLAALRSLSLHLGTSDGIGPHCMRPLLALTQLRAFALTADCANCGVEAFATALTPVVPILTKLELTSNLEEDNLDPLFELLGSQGARLVALEFAVSALSPDGPLCFGNRPLSPALGSSAL
jgi:hypothetical protein